MSTNPPSNKTIKVNCGQLCESNECNSSILNLLNQDIRNITSNIKLGLEKFVNNPESLSTRVIDLLHIAAYVFCADRMVSRGQRTSLSNSGWARSFEFHIPVDDIDFWSDSRVSLSLRNALEFMTGDRSYSFNFVKVGAYSSQQQLSLFKDEYNTLTEASITDVMLFSGGLDSLAGAIERLNSFPNRNLCLVSHKSNAGTVRTQRQLVEYLKRQYKNGIIYYGFECHNKKTAKPADETQRTRMFLFSSIAYAICSCYKKSEFYVYENGITSINLSKQEDVINGRASRTTHPKTLGLLQRFFRYFDADFCIVAPYYNKTKKEIVEAFGAYNEENLISSSISCSSSRRGLIEGHCGCCSQCIDRIFAINAARLQEYDVHVYDVDIIHDTLSDEIKQRLYNTLRLARPEHDLTVFYGRHPSELMDVIEYWPSDNPDDSLREIHDLFIRYGNSVSSAIKEIQYRFDEPFSKYADNTFLKMIAERRFLMAPTYRRVQEINRLLSNSIRLMFQKNEPKDENDLNDKIEAILSSYEGGRFTREYPSLAFGLTTYKADHAIDGLIIEAKYLRKSTRPSVATEGIAADITKVPDDIAGILFIVYDPERSIKDEETYIHDLEDRGKKRGLECYVRIYR